MIHAINKLPDGVRPDGVITDDISIYYLHKDHYSHALVSMINEAKSRIRVSMFAMSERFRISDRKKNSVYHALLCAGERGLVAQAVLSETGPFAWNRHFNLSAHDGLTNAGYHVRYARRSELLHQKQIIIDDDIVIIGSHNIGQASVLINRDVSVAIKSKEFHRIAMKEFKLCWQKGYK
jgi:phosphatidylserine/phosphatidylglycerophosphate/cardiolipin synthase-like enzyme